MLDKFLLAKVSLTPITTKYPDDFSEDIKLTLDKLNRTPVIINIPYLNELLKLTEDQMITINKLTKPQEIEAIALA
jgi:hypothetical protein